MADGDEVYFPLTGDETHAFICVRLYAEDGVVKADTSTRGPIPEGADYLYPPAEGEPREVLRSAREFAGLRGLDLRIHLDGVEWNPDLGVLV